MDQLKKVLTLIAIILIALLLLAGIGFIYNVFFLLLLIAAALGALKVFGFFRAPNPKQLHAPDPHRELEKVQRILDQYKQKQDR